MDSLSDSERETTALIVEVTGTSAALILSEQHNHAFHFYTPNSPQSLWSGTEPNYSREQTPVESVDRETKTYFRLPWTRLHEKDGYLFGREESNVHFLLPCSLGRALSAVHFKLFLSKHKTWMIESLSSNGTMYLGHLRQFEQRALHPDEPNEIRIGDLRLTVHVPNNHIPCQLRYGTYRSGYNEASIGPTPSVTSRTSSDTAKQLSQTPRMDESEYHICRSRPVPPAKPKKFVAVRTWDGRPCVMKPYSGPQSHYVQIMGPSRSCESIISYIELLENGELGQTIVTEYVSALTLAELRADSVIEPTMVSLVYGDIIRALRFLEESDLVHRDIRLETILASPARVWLTGFSACIRRGVTPRWLGNCDYGAPEFSLLQLSSAGFC
ncbi:hypothetical protein DL95DRAFT_104640 [Leptodontidium sp. 2 PMI_412]|nr:hypothetical protein DL95DRAFT_104640 [Leptodontidium sp. 2 PMI_412]